MTTLDRELTLYRSKKHAHLAALAELVTAMVAASLDEFQPLADEARRISQLPDPERSHLGRALLRQYGQWSGAVAEVLADADRAERAGHAIPRSEDLRRTHREVRVYVDNADRILQAATQLDAGRGIPLEEGMNELRRRAGA